MAHQHRQHARNWSLLLREDGNRAVGSGHQTHAAEPAGNSLLREDENRAAGNRHQAHAAAPAGSRIRSLTRRLEEPSSSSGQSARALYGFQPCDRDVNVFWRTANPFQYDWRVHVGPEVVGLDGVRGPSSSSEDDRRDDSGYYASGSAEDERGGSGDSFRCDAGGMATGVTADSGCGDPDRSGDSGCGDAAQAPGAGEAGEADKMHTEKLQQLFRQALVLDAVTSELQKIQDERSRELRGISLFPLLPALAREAQAQPRRTLSEVKRELRALAGPPLRQVPCQAGMSKAQPAWPEDGAAAAPVRILDADEMNWMKEQWFPGRGRPQAGPLTFRALADTGQIAAPSQSDTRTPTGQSLMTQGASARTETEKTPGARPSTESNMHEAGAVASPQLFEDT